MAGGYGSRFWPICRDDNPKQFIDILGNGQSMLQTTFERYERICPRENIIIVTAKAYAERVREQIKGLLPYQVLSEPTRRNTAPCIAYAASVIGEMNPNANVIVTPSDHAVFGRAKFEHDMEQALPAKLAEMDSLRKLEEDKKAYKDSVIEYTPRILSTFAVPDSMQYKRIIEWTVDQDFHRIDVKEPDTTYNIK